MKSEYLEKIHTHTGRMCKLHIEGSPGQDLKFFHQPYNQRRLNETSEDLLY